MKWARQSLASWRATGENSEHPWIASENSEHSGIWLANCSSVGEPLARTANISIINLSGVSLSFLPYPSYFFFLVASHWLHTADSTCPPPPTQVRKRVEEFPYLKYTDIKLSNFTQMNCFLFGSFLLVFVCFAIYVSSKRVIISHISSLFPSSSHSFL